MSATADADLFADYFQNPSKRANENAIKAVKTSKITIPGFTHPVKEYYLEDVFEETRFLVGQNLSTLKQRRKRKDNSRCWKTKKTAWIRTRFCLLMTRKMMIMMPDLIVKCQIVGT